MKRTIENILEKAGDRPFPKQIRILTLRKLVSINYAITIGSSHVGISIDDLKKEPKKCVEFIMKFIKVNRRTAYDYYTSLLYIHHYLPTAYDYHLDLYLTNVFKNLRSNEKNKI